MSTDKNKLQKLNPGAGVIPTTPKDAVAYWDLLAEQFARATVASQVMCGFALIELRAEAGVQRGGDQKNGSKPSVFGFDTWAEFIEKTYGFSDETGRTRIKMAEGVKAKFKKLGLGERFKALLQHHPSEWSEAETKLISDALQKATDGMTQTDFFRDLGLAKGKPGNPNGGPGAAGHKQPTMAEEAALRKQQAEENWGALDKGLMAYADKFILLPDTDVEAQIAGLEQALKARREWLKNPVGKRDAKAVADLFKR